MRTNTGNRFVPEGGGLRALREPPLYHYGTGAWGDGAKAYICDRLGEVGAAEAAIFYPLHHPIFGEVAFF